MRSGLPEGRNVRLSDHADIEYGMLPDIPQCYLPKNLPGRISSWFSTAPPTIAGKELALPNNISLLFLPPYSPELNPKENLWDEIREKTLQELRPQIHRRRARQTQTGDPLYRT